MNVLVVLFAAVVIVVLFAAVVTFAIFRATQVFRRRRAADAERAAEQVGQGGWVYMRPGADGQMEPAPVQVGPPAEAQPMMVFAAPPPQVGPSGEAQPMMVFAAPPQQRTNPFAITSMILGLVGGSILAVVFGHIALSQIRRTGDSGRGMAIAGLVLGYIWTGLVIAYFVFIAALFARWS